MGKAKLTFTALAIALLGTCVLTGCSFGSSSTGASANYSKTLKIAVSDKPVYRISASQVRDTDRKSDYKYENGVLTSEFEYGGISDYTYKEAGLVREEKTDGNNGIATTYIEEASCDDLGRIISVSRSWRGSVVCRNSYEYYGDTLNLKTHTEIRPGSGSTRIEEYDEDGFITSITEDGKTATFTYSILDEEFIGFEYVDFDGEVSRLSLSLDENGNVQTIYDGKQYIDFVYEEVSNPTAWLFTETASSIPMIGYTTRALFDTR